MTRSLSFCGLILTDTHKNCSHGQTQESIWVLSGLSLLCLPPFLAQCDWKFVFRVYWCFLSSSSWSPYCWHSPWPDDFVYLSDPWLLATSCWFSGTIFLSPWPYVLLGTLLCYFRIHSDAILWGKTPDPICFLYNITWEWNWVIGGPIKEIDYKTMFQVLSFRFQFLPASSVPSIVGRIITYM